MTLCLACARPVGDGHVLTCPQVFAAYPAGAAALADFHVGMLGAYEREQQQIRDLAWERERVRRMEEELGVTPCTP